LPADRRLSFSTGARNSYSYTSSTREASPTDRICSNQKRVPTKKARIDSGASGMA
jgi:hypothetical protein